MRLAVVGAGGLGCGVLLALAARRQTVTVVLTDPDRVELSNLHRQILYGEGDVGSYKAEVAARRMRKWGLRVEAHVGAFEPQSGLPDPHVQGVFDAVDRFETKRALALACARAGVPHLFAAASGWTGQVFATSPESPCLACAFPVDPVGGTDCASQGVFGPLLGRVAAEQVRQAAALWAGNRASGRLWTYDARHGQAWEVQVGVRAGCPCGAAGSPVAEGPRCSQPAPDPHAPVVDLRGLVCPDTYLCTRRRLESMPPGAQLWVVFSSDESARNVPASALAAGHRVLSVVREGPDHHVLLQRGA